MFTKLLSWFSGLFKSAPPPEPVHPFPTGVPYWDKLILKEQLCEARSWHPIFYEYFYCPHPKCGSRHQYSHVLAFSEHGITCWRCSRDIFYGHIKLWDRDKISHPDTCEYPRTGLEALEAWKAMGKLQVIFPKVKPYTRKNVDKKVD